MFCAFPDQEGIACKREKTREKGRKTVRINEFCLYVLKGKWYNVIWIFAIKMYLIERGGQIYENFIQQTIQTSH